MKFIVSVQPKEDKEMKVTKILKKIVAQGKNDFLIKNVLFQN